MTPTDRPPVTDNARAEMTTDPAQVVERAAQVIHDQIVRAAKSGRIDIEVYLGRIDFERGIAQALGGAGLLATARTRPTLAEVSLRLALEMDCERVYDDNANAYYCNEHDVGWLSDTNQCVRAERLADAVLALLEGGGDE